MFNKIIIMGRLCSDPEMKQTASGLAVTRIRVAVNRPKNKETGEQETDFFNVSCWRGTADLVCRYFSKGKMILVEGQMRNNDYTDNNGVKHYAMEILASSVAFCGDSAQNGAQNGGQASPNYAAAAIPAGQPAQPAAYSVPAQAYAQPQMPQAMNPAQAMFGNPASPYGAAAPMAQPQLQRPAQAQTAPAPRAGNAQNALSIGNLNEFEDILSDGELPF